MNLDTLERGLMRLANGIDKAVSHHLLEKLGKYGVEYAKSQVQNIDTGETVNSIRYDVQGNTLIIEAGGNAVWLEFGTGVARNASDYPGELPDGIVPHGEYGQGHGANGNGWYYPTYDERLAIKNKDGVPATFEDGTYIAHTFGIEANMFMWKTADVIEQKASEWGLEIISEELKYD